MLQPFSFIFYKKSGLVSNLIKWFTKGRYSHVALILNDFHTLELSWKSPTSIQHFKYPKDSYDLYTLASSLSNEQQEKILEFIKKNIDTKYDWLYIITRGFNLLFGTKIINSSNRYNCDELIVDAFKYAGIELVSDEKLNPDILSQSKYLNKM